MQAAAPVVILWTVLLAVPPACHADMEINPFEDPGVYSDCSLFTRAPTRVGAAIGGVTGMALGIAAIPLTVPFWVLGSPRRDEHDADLLDDSLRRGRWSTRHRGTVLGNGAGG